MFAVEYSCQSSRVTYTTSLSSSEIFFSAESTNSYPDWEKNRNYKSPSEGFFNYKQDD